MELDAEGGAHAVTPKTKYIVPAIDVLLAPRHSTASTLIIIIASKLASDHKGRTSPEEP